MTDDEKSAAFARWNHDTSRSDAGMWDAFMAGVAAAEARIATLERQRNALLAACEQSLRHFEDDHRNLFYFSPLKAAIVEAKGQVK